MFIRKEESQKLIWPRMSYFGHRQRRSLVSWRLCLTILAIISSPGFCRSITGNLGSVGFSAMSSSSPRKTLDEEIGSPSELAWQAWLLVEDKSGSQSVLDSSNILRRITPKSIFIAPDLVSCPSGYSTDSKGVCKPDPIKIDEDAQRQFFLKRLNALYGKVGNNRKKPAEVGGPLQFNIPISLSGNMGSAHVHPLEPRPFPHKQSEEPVHTVDQGIATGDRVEIPAVISQQPPVQSENNKSHDAVAVLVYKVPNNTNNEQKQSTEDDRTTFHLGSANSSAPKKDAAQIGQVVPVAEIMDEMNETFSGLVDYKIPISLKSVLNRSDMLDQTKVGDTRQQSLKKVDGSDSSEDSSPTVVLLLSPTKLPFTSTTRRSIDWSKVDVSQEPSDDQKPEQHETMTVQTTESETKLESDATIQTVAPLDMQTAVDPTDSTSENTEKAYTQSRLEDETAYTDEASQTEQESEDHGDYDGATDEVDQDDFGESDDELLKPGEAGMMMSHKNQDLIRSKNQKQHMSTLGNLEDLTSTTFVDTTTIPTFPTMDMQDSFDASDSTIKAEATEYTREDILTTQTTEIPSTVVTTEPTIEETTTFVTRPFRIKHTAQATTRTIPTQIPITTSTDIFKDKIDLKELLEAERDLVTEPEVIFSTQGSHGMSTTYGRKKPAHPAKTMEAPYTLDDLDDVVSRTELPPLPDFYHRNPTDHRRQQPSVTINNEPIFFKNDGNIPSEFKDQMADSSKPSYTDFRQVSSHDSNDESTYVRFPQGSLETRSQHGYVRFPSDEVNSIHNQEYYKDHLLSPFQSRDEYNGNSPTSTKSSVSVRQKPASTHWRVPPPGLRMDRQNQQPQTQTSSSTSNQRQQKQKPMLLRFWARMPLVRDLDFYPTTSHGSHNEPIGGSLETHRVNSRSPGRRVNQYKEIPPFDVNRLLAQHSDQSAIGG